MKTAAVVAATGAFVAGAASMGSGTAAAEPAPTQQPRTGATAFGVAAHVLPSKFALSDGVILP